MRRKNKQKKETEGRERGKGYEGEEDMKRERPWMAKETNRMVGPLRSVPYGVLQSVCLAKDHRDNRPRSLEYQANKINRKQVHIDAGKWRLMEKAL